jgi:hypothetical protein
MIGDTMENISDSKIQKTPTVTTDTETIEFLPQTVPERVAYMTTLKEELVMRDLPTTGTLEQLRTRLRLQLEGEKELRELKAKLDHCTPDENALYELLLAIPCILHMENRIGIKLVEMVLTEGGSHAIAGDLFGHIAGKVGKTRFQAFAREIEQKVNNEILGDDVHSAQWRFPMGGDGKSVSPLRMHTYSEVC